MSRSSPALVACGFAVVTMVVLAWIDLRAACPVGASGRIPSLAAGAARGLSGGAGVAMARSSTGTPLPVGAPRTDGTADGCC